MHVRNNGLAIVFYTWMCVELCSTAAAETAAMTVIQLHAVPATTVMDAIQPMLLPTEAITGQGTMVIVQALPQRLIQIREAINALDHAAPLLLISVRQGSSPDSMATDKGYHLQTKNNATQVQQLRVADGQMAVVSHGEEFPYLQSVDAYINMPLNQNDPHANHAPASSRGKSQTQQPTNSALGVNGEDGGAEFAYKSIVNGIMIRPTLIGTQVDLVISRKNEQMSALGAGQINTAELNTTTRVPLGRWINVSQLAYQSSRTDNPNPHRYITTRTDKDSSSDLWVKVERVTN